MYTSHIHTHSRVQTHRHLCIPTRHTGLLTEMFRLTTVQKPKTRYQTRRTELQTTCDNKNICDVLVSSTTSGTGVGAPLVQSCVTPATNLAANVIETTPPRPWCGLLEAFC